MKRGLDDELTGAAAQEARANLLRPSWLLSAARRRQPPAEVADLLARGAVGPTPATREAIRRDSRRRRGLAVADLCTLVVAYLVVTLMFDRDFSLASELPPLLAALPFWILLNKLLGLYDADANLIHKSTLNELPRIIQSILLGAGVLFLLGPLVGVGVTRAGTLAFIAVAVALNCLMRYGVRRAAQSKFSCERCLVVGSGPVAESVARKIEGHPEYGAEVVGFADAVDRSQQGQLARRFFPLERPVELEEICRQHGVERIILAFTNFSAEEQLEVIQTSKLLNVKVSVVPRLFEVTGPAVEVDSIEGMTLLGLRGFTRTKSSLILKRAIDVAVAGVGLLAMLPLLAAIAIATKLSSPGPVLYSQPRIGRQNRPFRIYKFRTMVKGADALKPRLAHLNEAHGPMFKIKADPRVTGLGRFLRRTSLDELPQLWNVLKGEMSLVGPRPLVADEDGHVIGWHRERLKLTPGLTGPWQVLGRTAIPFHEMVRLDYLYVAEWSLWNDFKVLARTVPVVLGARGV